MKKKLMALAALATCVTIGGVYAGWLYAEDPVSTAYGNAAFGITGIEGQASMGSLAVAGSNIALTVDDTADGKVHNTVLTYNTADFFTVTFTANANAEGDVKTDGIVLEWYLGLADLSDSSISDVTTTTSNDNIIFNDGTTSGTLFETFDTNAVEITSADKISGPTTNADGTVTFTYKIMLNDIIYSNYAEYTADPDNVTLVPRIKVREFTLSTKEMHSSYSSKISKVRLHFHVRQKTN